MISYTKLDGKRGQVNTLIKKFGRVRDFDSSEKKYTIWTFWTYAINAMGVLGELGKPIARQVRGYKSLARKKAKEAIDYAFKHRKPPAQ